MEEYLDNLLLFIKEHPKIMEADLRAQFPRTEFKSSINHLIKEQYIVRHFPPNRRNLATLTIRPKGELFLNSGGYASNNLSQIDGNTAPKATPAKNTLPWGNIWTVIGIIVTIIIAIATCK